jgi:hypothetical protein
VRFDLARSVTVAFGATWGLVPSTTLPRVSLVTTGASFVTMPSGKQRIAGLAQLHIDILGEGTYRSPNTSTTIVGTTFGIGGCLSPLYDSRGLALMICFDYGGGLLILTTSGPGGGPAITKNVGFGAATALAEVQYNVSRHVLLSARLAGTGETGDITAERADGSRIFKSGYWSASAMAGVGFRF